MHRLLRPSAPAPIGSCAHRRPRAFRFDTRALRRRCTRRNAMRACWNRLNVAEKRPYSSSFDTRFATGFGSDSLSWEDSSTRKRSPQLHGVRPFDRRITSFFCQLRATLPSSKPEPADFGLAGRVRFARDDKQPQLRRIAGIRSRVRETRGRLRRAPGDSAGCAGLLSSWAAFRLWDAARARGMPSLEKVLTRCGMLRSDLRFATAG